MGRLALVLLLAAIGSLAAPVALAAGVGGTKIVIVRPANGPPIMVETLVRLRGELISAGFETELVDSLPPEAMSANNSRSGLEQLAARRGADAVVAIVGDLSPDSVEVWVVDKVTGKSLVRRVPFEATAARASETLALRAIELLRSSFLEIDLAARDRREGPGATAPPTVVRFVDAERLARHPERFGVEVGGAALLGLDGVGPAVLPLVRLDWSWGPLFLAQATLAGLGTRPTVESAAGSAQLAQAYGLVGGNVRFRPAKQLRPFASLSAGVLRTSVEGRADPPNQGRSVGQWSFLLDAGTGVFLRLPDRFYLLVAAHVQVAEPYLAVRFVDAVVATSGRPNILFTVAVGAWL